MNPFAQRFFIIFFFSSAILQGGWIFPSSSAAQKCPPGSTAVEDIATERVTCEGADRLDTRARPRRSPGVPGKPGVPGIPATPASPGKALSVAPPADCGLARWGCEQACQQTYLASATGSSAGASQRAKVQLGACLRVCKKEFPCEPKAPEVSSEREKK